jgi:hypothetical protein
VPQFWHEASASIQSVNVIRPEPQDVECAPGVARLWIKFSFVGHRTWRFSIRPGPTLQRTDFLQANANFSAFLIILPSYLVKEKQSLIFISGLPIHRGEDTQLFPMTWTTVSTSESCQYGA